MNLSAPNQSAAALDLSLPDQSLTQLTEFVMLLESLEALEQSAAQSLDQSAEQNNKAVGVLNNLHPLTLHPLTLHPLTLHPLTRQTLLAEFQTYLAEEKSRLRSATSRPSFARMTLARLKRDARQALDIESINSQQSTSAR